MDVRLAAPPQPVTGTVSCFAAGLTTNRCMPRVIAPAPAEDVLADTARNMAVRRSVPPGSALARKRYDTERPTASDAFDQQRLRPWVRAPPRFTSTMPVGSTAHVRRQSGARAGQGGSAGQQGRAAAQSHP